MESGSRSANSLEISSVHWHLPFFERLTLEEPVVKDEILLRSDELESIKKLTQNQISLAIIYMILNIITWYDKNRNIFK
jgi:hypothetical protein